MAERIYEVVRWPSKQTLSRHRSLDTAKRAMVKRAPKGQLYKYRVKCSDGKWYF